jgi:hypothetical protein
MTGARPPTFALVTTVRLEERSRGARLRSEMAPNGRSSVARTLAMSCCRFELAVLRVASLAKARRGGTGIAERISMPPSAVGTYPRRAESSDRGGAGSRTPVVRVSRGAVRRRLAFDPTDTRSSRAELEFSEVRGAREKPPSFGRLPRVPDAADDRVDVVDDPREPPSFACHSSERAREPTGREQ